MFRNLTPHVVTLVMSDGSMQRIEPDGLVVRVAKEVEIIKETPVRVVKESFGKIQDLPEQEEGVDLIVSNLCCQAAPDRKDLFFPTDPVRDEEGRIVAARALGQI